MKQEHIEWYQKQLVEYEQTAEEYRSLAKDSQIMAERYQKMADGVREVLKVAEEFGAPVETQETATEPAIQDVYPGLWDSEPWQAHHRNAPGIKLNEEKAERIRILYAEHHWSINALSWKYQVSSGDIRHIIEGERWREAGGPTFPRAS